MNEATGTDHDLLIQLNTKFDAFSSEMKDANKQSTEKITDHEVRIRALERHDNVQDGTISGVKSATYIANGIILLVIAALGIWIGITQ